MKINKKIFVLLAISGLFATNAFAFRMVGAPEANPEAMAVGSNIPGTMSNAMDNYAANNHPVNDNMNKMPVKKKKTKKTSKISLYKKILIKQKLKNIINEMDFNQKISFLKKQLKVQEELEIENIKFQNQLLEYKIQLLDNRLYKLTSINPKDLRDKLYIYMNDPRIIVKKVDYNKIIQGQNDKLLLRYMLAEEEGLIRAKFSGGVKVSLPGMGNTAGGMAMPGQVNPAQNPMMPGIK